MTAPTPERPLDVEALRRLADEYAGPDLEEVAAEEFELRVGETVAPMLGAILAALAELEGLRPAAVDVVQEIEDCLAAGEAPRLGPIAGWATHLRVALRAAREAEEASGEG